MAKRKPATRDSVVPRKRTIAEARAAVASARTAVADARRKLAARADMPAFNGGTVFPRPMIARVHMRGDEDPVEVRRVLSARWLPAGTMLYGEGAVLLATAPGSATIVYTPEPSHGR